jgi:hypothetical protein
MGNGPSRPSNSHRKPETVQQRNWITRRDLVLMRGYYSGAYGCRQRSLSERERPSLRNMFHGRRQMPLPGRVVAAPPGVHGFDANSVLNRRICEVAKARGFEFCIRYVSRQDAQPVGDLSEAEANVILGAGLALMPVQHVAPENWSPSQALGTRNGKNAAKHARQIGFPEGVNVWLDLEGAKTSTTHEAMIAYCSAWFAEVEGAGFVPGVYVGAMAILTGNELFWRLTTKHYWKSGSRVPDIPHRGYQLIQTIIRNDKIDGVAIDRNLTKNDNFGGSVLWLSESRSADA